MSSLTFSPIFQEFSDIFGGFSSLTLLPLWVVANKSMARLRPLDWCHSDQLAIGYQSMLITTTGSVIDAVGDNM